MEIRLGYELSFEVPRPTPMQLMLYVHPEQASRLRQRERVQAVVEWVHTNVVFGYQFARPTKSAADVYLERQGVCRDFQHLAIAFLRALNIPARYATGFLGDIGVPPSPSPMDFSAWSE